MRLTGASSLSLLFAVFDDEMVDLDDTNHGKTDKEHEIKLICISKVKTTQNSGETQRLAVHTMQPIGGVAQTWLTMASFFDFQGKMERISRRFQDSPST